MSKEWTAEQLNILNSVGNTLVSASAGSGKTSVMVKKIVGKILCGVPIGKILVASYTEASAADMRAKIVEELYSVVSKMYDELSKKELSEEDGKKIREQLDDLPFADIGTMDSFCAKLIRDNFEVLGISPAMSQMDDGEATEMRRRIMNKIIEKSYEEGNERFLKVVSKMSNIVDDAPLADVVLRLYEAMSINPEPEKFVSILKECATADPDGYYGKIIMDYYKGLAADMLPYIRRETDECDLSGAPLYEETADKALEILSIIASAEKSDDVSMLPEFPRLAGKGISDEDKEAVKDIRKKTAALKKNLKDALFVDYKGYDTENVREFIDVILGLAEKFKEVYTLEKRRRNKLDFNDLSRLAIELLSDGDRAKNIAQSYECVFVDEYQDINPLHEYVLKKITNGNMFMVGDSKQSIYAFRNADTGIFLGKKALFDKYPEQGTALKMTTNFRSTVNILNFANSVFSAVMTSAHGGIDYREESLFVSCKDAKEGEPVEIKLFCAPEIPSEREMSDVYSVQNHIGKSVFADAAYGEGAKTAELIKELVAFKGYRYDDIAVLFSKRSVAEGFLRALADEEIPFISDGFVKNVGIKYKKQLINLLKVLDNAQNDIPFTGYLLSWFGKFDEKEIAKIRVRYPKLSLYEGVKQAQIDMLYADKCAAVLKFIKDCRDRAAYTTVDKLLSDIILDSGFDAYVLSDSDGRDAMQAVNAFIYDIGRLDCSDDIGAFLEYRDNMGDEQKGLPPAEFGNAVKISTVHGSKGLEYKVVFLAAVQSVGNKGNRADFIFDKDYGVGVKLYNEADRSKIPSLAYNAITLMSKRRNIDEMIRLLYVALTRAQEKLYITGRVKSESEFQDNLRSPRMVAEATCFKDLLYFAAASDPKIAGAVTVESTDERIKDDAVRSAAVFNNPEKIYTDEIKKVVCYEYGHTPSTSVSNKYTVSEINRQDDDTAYAPSIFANEDNRKKGIAYHAVMENIDFNISTLSEVNLFIAALAARGILTTEEADLVDGQDILNCINSPIIKNGIKGRYLREQPFMLRVKASEVLDTKSNDMILVQGTADLVLLGSGQNTVIDFKYSGLPDEKLAEKYEKQLNLYKLAIERAQNVVVTDKKLYSFTSNRFIEIS